MGGVPFAAFFHEVLAPAARPGAPITHLTFGGLDRYRSIVALEDALAGDVLLAEHLDGRPLDTDHGAPLRLVSPSQYGFISTKHLCRIELLTSEPREGFVPPGHPMARLMRRPLFDRHPRSRVWHEERSGFVPTWALRPVYRALIPPIRALSARGSREGR